MKTSLTKFKKSRIQQGINETVLQHRGTSSLFARTAWMVALATGSVATVQAQQEQLEEIQITGSRIVRSTMQTPTPVTTIQAEELSSMAPGNLIEGLTQMPQFYGNQTPEQVNGGQNSGGSNVNLRGAGTNRTLTLLNGRRVVPSNRFGTVDVNLFPEDLLRSVENVTGGASASYGTDAVAGVVNFILDTDYVGFKTHTQTGITEYGDGRTWEAGAAFGKDLGNGLHILGSLAAADQSKISSPKTLRDRDFLVRSARITNPDPNGPTDIIRPYVQPTTFNRTGVLIDNTRPGINRLVFTPQGNLVPMDTTPVGAITNGCLCYADDDPNNLGIDSDNEIGNSFRRYNGFLYLDYDLSENTNLFAQAIYADNSASDQRESITLQSSWQGRVYPDNAFLSTQARDVIVASGAPFVGYGLAALNEPDTLLGESRQETNNETYSTTFGFDHEFAFGWNLNGYYQYGKNVQDFVTVNGVRTDRMQLAFDAVRNPATGQIVCRVNLPEFTGPISAGGNGGLFSDCAPINTFGGVQNISQAGADYIIDRDGKTARQWTDQHVAELVASGEIFDGFGAGPVDAAFGVSYRKEELEQRTLDASDEFPGQVNGTLLSDQGIHPAALRGLVPQGQNGGIAGYNGIPGLRFVPAGYLGDQNSSSVLFSSLRAIAGGYNVKEAFTEFNWPLLSGITGVESLEVNTAARWADYSGSGDIWAWKISGNWEINEEVRLRATRSRDVRAASLRERYDQTRGGANVANPWDNRNQVQAASLSGGNPNVSPEEADTITAGVVFQPNWLDGFSASLDWYQIDIDGALAQLTAQNIVDNCFRGEISLCQYVISNDQPITNPAGGFRPIDRVEAIFINLQTQKIEGADMELVYRGDVDFFGDSAEDFSVRFLTSYLKENSIQSQGGILDDRAGQIGALGFPDLKVTTNLTYNIENYSLFLQGRWIGDGLLDRTRLQSTVRVPGPVPAGSILAACGTNICTIDDNSVPSTFYMDARITGRFGEDENLQVFANVQNLFDRAPIITPGTGVGRTGTGTGVNGIYDILGRRYTIGVNYEF
ncbi:MAG: TonB-dependent receptor [Pseudomonadota bacterium]